MVEAHSMQLAHLYICTYILYLMCPVVAVYHGMASLPICSEIDEARRTPLSRIRENFAFKRLQQRHMLDTPMAKPRSRWPESSLPNSFNFSNITLIKIFHVINFHRMLPSTNYF